jgi:hypothetical protein
MCILILQDLMNIPCFFQIFPEIVEYLSRIDSFRSVKFE